MRGTNGDKSTHIFEVEVVVDELAVPSTFRGRGGDPT